MVDEARVASVEVDGLREAFLYDEYEWVFMWVALPWTFLDLETSCLQGTERCTGRSVTAALESMRPGESAHATW